MASRAPNRRRILLSKVFYPKVWKPTLSKSNLKRGTLTITWNKSMKVEQKGTDIIILIDEFFDFKMLENFRKAYESVDPKSFSTLRLDFSDTRYMDSSALGMLLNVQKYFANEDITIVLCKVSEQIKKVLSISKFDRRFEIQD